MPKKLEEITATFLRERLRFEGTAGDTIVGRALLVDGNDAREVTVKGLADDDEPASHQTYRWYGSWVEYTHPRFKETETQFHFRTFVRSTPHGRAGIVRYLERAPNVGRVIASRLWERFNSDAVRVLREQPEVAAAACDRLSAAGALEAAEWLETEKRLENCTIDLINLLDGRGFPKSVPRELVKDHGNQAAEWVRRSPYRLMRYRGCGFKRCDALFLDLGGNPAKLKRQAMCAAYAAGQATATSGDTWNYVGVIEQGLKGAVAGADVQLEKAMRLAERGQILRRLWTDGPSGRPSWDGDTEWVSDARKAGNERRVADFVAEASREPGWATVVDAEHLGGVLTLTQHQTQLLAKALGRRGAIGILGGSPGTGKTFTAAQLIGWLVEAYGVNCLAVIAPTGKAAVRITESMASYGICIRAHTIHSLLVVDQSDDRGGWSFTHNRANPLPFRFLIVDESSMIDCDLMASLLAARAIGSCVLLVGDVNQLPPVGHGAPLRDLIAAGLPYGELTEIMRNDGGIVQACADMREGRRFQPGGNLLTVGCASPERQTAAVLETLHNLRRDQGCDPVWGCQVLVAVNKKSPLSRQELNKLLQNHLNPNPVVHNSPFRLGDKVVCLKNGFYSPDDGFDADRTDCATNAAGQVYVANGELAKVIEVEAKMFKARLVISDMIVRVPRGGQTIDNLADNSGDGEEVGAGCNWDLAYALSVHKSQGSEWPYVIVLIDEYPGARKICDRSWWYTAISRAKKACWLVGNLGTAQRMASVNNLAKRKTFLKELIDERIQRNTLPVLPPQEECDSQSGHAILHEVFSAF